MSKGEYLTFAKISKEDAAYCSTCIFNDGRETHLCNYILYTGERRGCKPGVGCSKRDTDKNKLDKYLKSIFRF